MHKPILRGETVILQLLVHWPLAPVTLWWVAVDLYMRPALDLRLTQWGWWLLSVGFSLVMWQGLFSISRLLRARRQMAFVGAVSLGASALLMASITKLDAFCPRKCRAESLRASTKNSSP